MIKLTFLTVMPSPYQRQLFRQIARLEKIDLAVAYYTYGARDREWKRPALEPYETVLPGTTITPIGNAAHVNLSIGEWMASRKSDLTVVSDYSAPTAQLAMRSLSSRQEPFVFWGEAPGFQSRGRVGSWVRKKLQSPLNDAAAIAAIGSRAVEIYQDLFPQKQIHNIPYYCDLKPYISASLGAKKQPERVNILFSGQLIERKGIDVLLSAFLRAHIEKPSLSLSILGGGPMRHELERSIPTQFTDSVNFLGHVEPEEIPPIFASSSVFCLPSRYDGWGVVVNEAIGAGLPIIVSDAVGAGHDLVEDDVNGLVVKAGDHDSLVSALIRVSDSSLRSRLSRAAEASREAWTLENGAQRWMNLAESVLDRKVMV